MNLLRLNFSRWPNRNAKTLNEIFYFFLPVFTVAKCIKKL
jgi:hypothetical protein